MATRKAAKKASTAPLTRVLTADDLLSSPAPQPAELPELGGIVYLRLPTAGQVLDYAGAKDDPSNQALLELIAVCIVNEDGSPLFTDSQLLRLRDMSISAFNVLSTRVLQMVNLSGIGEQEGEG
jgi:hypothetical protein